MDPIEAMSDLGLRQHQLRFTSTISLDDEGPVADTADRLYQKIKRFELLLFLTSNILFYQCYKLFFP